MKALALLIALALLAPRPAAPVIPAAEPVPGLVSSGTLALRTPASAGSLQPSLAGPLSRRAEASSDAGPWRHLATVQRAVEDGSTVGAQLHSLTGKASWVDASYGPRYLAARMPKGTGLRICGPLACTVGVVMDWGPSARRYPHRIVDLSRARFAKVCGDPETLGTCRVTVEVLGRIAPPQTDAEP